MTRPNARGQTPGETAGAAELALLQNWLLSVKGSKTFAQLSAAAAATEATDRPVTEATLRRAVDGRVPTIKAIRTWSAGAGVDPTEGERLRARVRAARSRLAQQRYDASRITTQGGLVRAMKRIRARAGEPTLRELEKSDEAAFRLPRSTLGAVLRGESPVTAGLLEAFLTACAVPEAEKIALLAARERVENPNTCGGAEWYPCAVADRGNERLEYERARSRYRGRPPGEDGEEDRDEWYEVTLRHQRLDPARMTGDELEELLSQAKAQAVVRPQKYEERRERLAQLLRPYLEPDPE
ncbi:hypothetical protein [Streptomyces sp. S1D4-20]|uniref:hypothetical protein n=1 Tax=Streptomyces sp. S1D4-20 TaxID=2594462 RepID=UPI0011627F9C|nr:hypothetical protein [Streptomyces sp. S1D4-20]QDN54156.1 hypothetical protein FNV67_00850 [Streptomyces sp. S1D4-20]